MEFPPCAQGNREGGKNSYTFYYIYKMKFFCKFVHRLDSSVSRATVSGLKGPRFESWPQKNVFFITFIFFYLKMLLLHVKMAILYGNVIKLIIYALKVLISECEKILFYNEMWTKQKKQRVIIFN